MSSSTARPGSAQRDDVAEVGFGQNLALLFGLTFLLVGFLGSFVSHDHSFAARDSGLLLGLFEVNTLHNLVHIGVGMLLLFAYITTHLVASLVNLVVGGVYFLLGVVGFFLLGSDANFLALNLADNFLHLALAAALAGAGALGVLSALRARRKDGAPRRRNPLTGFFRPATS